LGHAAFVDMKRLQKLALLLALGLTSAAAQAVVVTRHDIEEMVAERVSSPGEGGINQLASRICGIPVAQLGAPSPSGAGAGHPQITVQSLLPLFPAEGSATVHLAGVGVSDLTGRAVTGPCEGTIRFKYRFTEGWNGVSMEVHAELTEGPTLLAPDGAPVAAPAPKMGTGTLVITPDAACTLRIDGILVHALAPYGWITVDAMPGERRITCDSSAVTGVRAAETRKVEAGAKAAVDLSLQALEKAALAAAKPAPQGQGAKAARPADTIIDRGGGVLEQVSSGLLWTQRDNAGDVGWEAAYRYCDALQTSGGGWRLPAEPEFQSLYNDTVGVAQAIPCGDHTCSASPFRLSSWWFWTAERNDSQTAWIFLFAFEHGLASSYPVGGSSGSRALCVRTPRAGEADTAAARARLASEAASRRPVVAGKEIDRGGGVLEQVSSGLLWTQRDNGADLSRDEARRYCEQLPLSGGGWRLPTRQALENLFLDAIGTRAVPCGEYSCGVPAGFSFSTYGFWAGDDKSSDTDPFVNFQNGMGGEAPAGFSYHLRALCVRDP
jgi:hypothetical protein